MTLTYHEIMNKFKSKFDILAVRNQETLNWYFGGTPQIKSQRKILEVRRNQDLLGYVALNEVQRNVGANRTVRYYEMIDAAQGL